MTQATAAVFEKRHGPPWPMLRSKTPRGPGQALVRIVAAGATPVG